MGCDDKCGCAVPCPGGAACRCASSARSGEAGGQRGGGDHHTTCSCGDHCGCSPCTCGRESLSTGRENRRAGCSCGDSCTCASCGTTTAART